MGVGALAFRRPLIVCVWIEGSIPPLPATGSAVAVDGCLVIGAGAGADAGRWSLLFARPASTTQAKTILLVATRDIEDGEELFIDYRLSLNVPHPTWYHVVDEEASRRIWIGSTEP